MPQVTKMSFLLIIGHIETAFRMAGGNVHLTFHRSVRLDCLPFAYMWGKEVLRHRVGPGCIFK